MDGETYTQPEHSATVGDGAPAKIVAYWAIQVSNYRC